MQISDRLASFGGDDDGWQVFYKARQMKRAGVDVVELTVGQHDIPTDGTILNAMHSAALNGHVGYTDIPGVPELREAVAKRTERLTGVPTSPANVWITPGGQSALFAAHMLALNPGNKALYIDPYYATYPGTLRAVSAQAVPVPAKAENDFQPKASDIRAAALGAKSLLINSPNNPTGALYSADTMNAIAQACRDHDMWLISDEVYDSQIWHGQHISPRGLPDMVERTLVVGSLSKSHAMTGSRIGWVIGPEPAIDALSGLGLHTTYGVVPFIQQGAIFALEQGPDFEAKIAEPFRRRRQIALEILQSSDVVRAIPADGAMYIMLDLRRTGLSGQDFANQLLDAHHIAVMPGESFGQAAAGHVRVAMTVDDQAFAKALQQLVKFADKLVN